MIEAWELVLRLIVAIVLGGLIGLEREFSDQPAGFRTHMLVSLGAALFTIGGAYGFEGFAGGDFEIQFDPTRVAAQVVTGIGFLGAGAIIQQGITIRGLTTAASLWVTAAIGLAAGFGNWWGAVGTTVIALLALYGLKQLERRYFPLMRTERFHLALETGPAFNLAELERVVEGHGASLRSMRMQATGRGAHRLAASLALGDEISPNALAEDISDLAGVNNVDWRR